MRCGAIAKSTGNQCKRNGKPEHGGMCWQHKYESPIVDNNKRCTAITFAGKRCTRDGKSDQDGMCWQHYRITVELLTRASSTDHSDVYSDSDTSDDSLLIGGYDVYEEKVLDKLPVLKVLNVVKSDGDATTFLKNMKGTSKDNRSPSWIKFYHSTIKASYQKKCCVDGCSITAHDGAHVKRLGSDKVYIAPMCKSHNHMDHGKYSKSGKTKPFNIDGEFYLPVKKNSQLVEITY